MSLLYKDELQWKKKIAILKEKCKIYQLVSDNMSDYLNQ